MEDLSKVPKAINNVLMRKDKRIKELQEMLKALTKKNAVMIDHFKDSTEALLERIKQLEAVSLGARPQTANILTRIGTLTKVIYREL